LHDRGEREVVEAATLEPRDRALANAGGFGELILAEAAEVAELAAQGGEPAPHGRPVDAASRRRIGHGATAAVHGGGRLSPELIVYQIRRQGDVDAATIVDHRRAW
jgi:hypothetical protein